MYTILLAAGFFLSYLFKAVFQEYHHSLDLDQVPTLLNSDLT